MQLPHWTYQMRRKVIGNPKQIIIFVQRIRKKLVPDFFYHATYTKKQAFKYRVAHSRFRVMRDFLTKSCEK